MKRRTTKPAPAGASTSVADASRALWEAGTRGESLSLDLARKLLPLLSLCEFATHAHDTLKTVDRAAAADSDLMDVMSGIAPGWVDAIERLGDMPGHIAQCLALAQSLCSRAAEEAQALAESAHAAGRDVGGRHE
jgi:hypothetical protein